MTYCLKHFDPLAGCLPPRLGLPFFDPLFHARQMLRHRSADDLQAMVSILNEISRDPDFRSGEFELLEQPPVPVAQENGEIIEAWPALSEVDLFVQNMEWLKLSDFQGPPGVDWHELFAVLTLCLIDQICELEKRLDRPDVPAWARPTEAHFDELVEQYAYRAKQAVSIAGQLKAEARTRKGMAKRGGKMRHAGSEALKGAVLELYGRKYRHLKNHPAATRILSDLSQEGRLTFEANGDRIFFDGIEAMHTENPSASLAKWIGRDRRLSES